MANTLYPSFKQAAYDGTGINLSTADVRAILVDTADYTYSAAHDMLDDVAAAARVATVALSGESWSSAVFDATDATFSSVTGDQSEAVILYIHTGTESTSRLIAYIDSASSGLPVTPNGGNITVAWDNGASKIFAL